MSVVVKMNLTICCLLALLLVNAVTAIGGKLKFVAIKRPHGAFIGLKVRKPKLLGLKHGLGGGFGGGFHSSGYEHHEYHHESYHSGGAAGGFGGKFGWLGK